MSGNMNLEEAKANIGKEVIFDNSIFENCNRPQIKSLKLAYRILIFDTRNSFVCINIFDDQNEMIDSFFVEPESLKIKEQIMNYKIKVTPETSEEVQKLFFELGYIWHFKGRKISYKEKPYLFAESDGYIMYDYNTNFFNSTKNQEITLPQLRDLAVLKRNDVNDATHEHIESGNKYYRGFKDYVFDGVEWILTDITFPNSLKPINRGMTWQDALCAVADGKDIDMRFNGEFEPLINLLEAWLYGKEFRIKPQIFYIKGGNYTKEELLKIAENM
ncbi:MAG: hypothetical protein [Bacteriophage sp.]|nr:MAG: hypothetical protein [Bacteriophage sp.]